MIIVVTKAMLWLLKILEIIYNSNCNYWYTMYSQPRMSDCQISFENQIIFINQLGNISRPKSTQFQTSGTIQTLHNGVMISFLNESVFLFLCAYISEYDVCCCSMQFEEISRKKAIKIDTTKLFQHIVHCLTKNKCSLNPPFFSNSSHCLDLDLNGLLTRRNF